MQVASRSSSQICTAALRHFTRSFHSSPQAFPLLFHATRLRTAPKLCQFEFITARQVRDFSIFRARQTQTQTRGDGRTTTSTNPPKSRTAPATPATSDVTERKDGEDGAVRKPTIRENIYTIPNLLTVSRIFACPVLGWSILQGDFVLSTSLLVYAGVSDLVDGFLARRYKMQSVLGTILDPAADKLLMTTLAVTLTMKGLLPMPLAVIILGRDVLLGLSAFRIRYTSLPHPKTFVRYWDFSLPSAEVRPTQLSKVNTGLQLVLMGLATVGPLLPFELGIPFIAFQWIVASSTIGSGFQYVFTKDAVRVISEKRPSPPPPPPS